MNLITANTLVEQQHLLFCYTDSFQPSLAGSCVEEDTLSMLSGFRGQTESTGWRPLKGNSACMVSVFDNIAHYYVRVAG